MYRMRFPVEEKQCLLRLLFYKSECLLLSSTYCIVYIIFLEHTYAYL